MKFVITLEVTNPNRLILPVLAEYIKEQIYRAELDKPVAGVYATVKGVEWLP